MLQDYCPAIVRTACIFVVDVCEQWERCVVKRRKTRHLLAALLLLLLKSSLLLHVCERARGNVSEGGRSRGSNSNVQAWYCARIKANE